MVVLDLDQQKQTNYNPDDEDAEALREERRRNGRYVSAGTAIFLSLLGLYEAIKKGSREFAAVFLTAVLMFGYILWLLYASKRHKRYFKMASLVSLQTVESPPVKPPLNDLLENKRVESTPKPITTPMYVVSACEVRKKVDEFDELVKELSETNGRTFSRSYSVA